VLPPRQQCELGDTGLQELELSGQDSFIAADNTKVLIPPIFQGLTYICMMISYIYNGVHTNFQDSGKERNKQTSDLPTAGIKFRSRKRVYEKQTSRVTRSKKNVAQSEASLTPSGIHVPSPVQSDASLTPSDIGADFQGYFYHHLDDDLSLHDENIQMTTEGDSSPQPNGQNHMANECDNFLLTFYKL
jgi:hypothetical protein